MISGQGRTARALAMTCCAFATTAMAPGTTLAQTDLTADAVLRKYAPGIDGARFDTNAWAVHDDAQIAVVAAQGYVSGIFAGVQCDPFDARQHRIIIGSLHTSATGPAAALATMPMNKLTVRTSMASIASQFDVAPEDRGHSDLRGGTEYVAAHLSQQQYVALTSAQAITIHFGTNDYRFTGRGSAKAIASLRCRSAPVHTAQRLIEFRREEMPRPKMGSWRLAFHSAGAAPGSGTADITATTTNNPLNIGADFKITVACGENQLVSRFGADINAVPTDRERWTRASAFLRELDSRSKFLEIYRNGKRTRTILIKTQVRGEKGRALTSDDLADLLAADQIIVVSNNMTIEFSTDKLAASLKKLDSICTAQG